MPATPRLTLTFAAVVALSTAGVAADFFGTDHAAPTGSESVAIEPFFGYLRGTAGEHVYDLPRGGGKLSQLDWRVDALAVGARAAARPLDWLTVRGRFWTTVASDGAMTDRDWLAGYGGPSTWTHKSEHPDTSLGKAWQADASLAVKFYEDDDLALTVIGGYRHYNVKYNARGGSYIYSINGFRDATGSFTPGQLGISYEQWFETPYLGFGAVYNTQDWTVSTEMIGSPFVMARARDHHPLRGLVFKDDFKLSNMVGANLGVEYRLSPVLSLAGRVDYQKYFEARGRTKIYNANGGFLAAAPSPAAGGEADTLLVSLGIKARL